MAITSDDEQDELVVPVDRETARRLMLFARAVGSHPCVVAGRLLADLMVDDEFWNAASVPSDLN